MEIDDKLKARIIARLKDLHTPEHITGRLRIEGAKISHETISVYIQEKSWNK